MGDRSHLTSRHCGDVEDSSLPMADARQRHATVRLSVRLYSRAKVIARYTAALRWLLALQDRAEHRVVRTNAESRMDGRAGQIRFL